LNEDIQKNQQEQITELKYFKTKRLPKNFSNTILDLELKIDSGNFDIECINKLMSLYRVSFLIIL